MVKAKYTLMIALLLSVVLGLNTLAWASDTQRTFYRVQNLSCGYCLGKIDSKLRELDGYLGMSASFEQGLIAVDHRMKLNAGEIVNALNTIGYPAKAYQPGSAQQRQLLTESSGWAKPSKGWLSRIIKIFAR